ncbi:MAG: phosphorylase [Rhodocyclaceae bacterium]|nr:phosphorylase [Rhodocyclaceae bacterium]
MDFQVRWLSTLAQKDRAAAALGAPRRENFNPFLPPETALVVADLSATHLVLLNKFPVIEGHVLIVTRTFVDQQAVLDGADFAALADIMEQLPGLGFYNGGRLAGASQAHKHLQFVPLCAPPLAAILPQDAPPLAALSLPQLPFRHGWVRLPPALPAQLAGHLLTAAQLALAHCDLEPHAGMLRPCNLLATREWLMVVARRREYFEHAGTRVAVNALGFAGSLFARQRAEMDVVREVGPFAVLRAVAEPA